MNVDVSGETQFSSVRSRAATKQGQYRFSQESGPSQCGQGSVVKIITLCLNLMSKTLLSAKGLAFVVNNHRRYAGMH